VTHRVTALPRPDPHPLVRIADLLERLVQAEERRELRRCARQLAEIARRLEEREPARPTLRVMR
jgi:hypothetical protein